MTTIPKFRARVRDLLLAQGRNQSWLAQRLGLGPASVSRLLGGERSLSRTTERVHEIARALGVPADVLVEDTELSLLRPEEETPSARVYRQRNRLAMLAARLGALSGLRAGRYRDPEATEERFAWVVQVDLPDGAVSFHVDANDGLLESIPVVARDWDGHDAAEAQRRLESCVRGWR